MQNTTEFPGLICGACVPEALYTQRSDTGSLPHYTTQERAAGQWAAVHDGKAKSRFPEDLPALCVCSV